MARISNKENPVHPGIFDVCICVLCVSFESIPPVQLTTQEKAKNDLVPSLRTENHILNNILNVAGRSRAKE